LEKPASNSPPAAATIRTAVSLKYTSNHVFHKVSVAWGISDGHIILAGLVFPQGDISGDTTFMFSFQFFQDPGILEGALSYLSSFLKFFDSCLSIPPHLYIR